METYTCFNSLPIDLLPLILYHTIESNCLSSKEKQSTLHNLEQVSRTWRGETLRLNLIVVTSSRQLYRLGEYLQQTAKFEVCKVQTLIIEFVVPAWAPDQRQRDSETDWASRKVGKCLPYLKRLEIHGTLGNWSICEFVDTLGFAGIQQLVVGPSGATGVRSESNIYPFLWRCRNLTSIEILPGVPAVLTNGLGDLTPPALTSVKIGSLGLDSVFGLRNLVDGLSASSLSLRSLHLGSYLCPRPETLGVILARHTALQDLRLGPCGSEQLGDEALWAYVAKLSNLETLSACPRSPLAFLYAIAALPKLQELRIPSILNLQGTLATSAIEDLATVIRRLCWLRSLGNFKQLKKVTLQRVLGLPSSALVKKEVQLLEMEGVAVCWSPIHVGGSGAYR